MLKKIIKKDPLDGKILELKNKLVGIEPGSGQWESTVTAISELEELKNKKNKVNSDTIAMIAGNLLITLVILNFEKTGSITSKAYSYIFKKY